MQTVKTLKLSISKDISIELPFYISLFKHFKVSILVIESTYRILFIKRILSDRELLRYQNF
jgi:hypothetical protein